MTEEAQPVQLGRPSKYPWEEWTNGEEHTIEQGKDFSLSVHNMRATLHVRASALGMKAKTRTLDGNQIAFQFLSTDSE